MATRLDNLSKRTAYFWGYELSIPPDVYEPAEDTDVLARALSSLADRLRGIVLDMGCGRSAHHTASSASRESGGGGHQSTRICSNRGEL